MRDLLEKCNWKIVGTFVGGVLFGTAGLKVLGSSDARKVYTGCVAAALRAKDCVMETKTTLQENAEDILAEAKEMNRARAEKEEEITCGCEDEEDFEEVQPAEG